RSSESEPTSSATVDDITWGSAPPPSPVGPESSPLLFRLALATAAVLLVLVVARTLWQPGTEPRAKAPKFAAAVHAPTPSPIVPPQASPVPTAPEPVVPEP